MDATLLETNGLSDSLTSVAGNMKSMQGNMNSAQGIVNSQACGGASSFGAEIGK